jgi:hypothetical protein
VSYFKIPFNLEGLFLSEKMKGAQVAGKNAKPKSQKDKEIKEYRK